MSDIDPVVQDQPVIETAGTDGGAEAPVEQPQGGSGGNPAWEPLKQKLDPLLFESIKSDLSEFDKQAQARITSVNQQFAPYKSFAEQGIKPEQIQQAMALAEMIDKDPAAIHQRLGEFLRETGRMPQTPKEIAEVVEGDGEDEETAAEDPRIAQLQAQQAQMQEFIQQQAQQRAEEEANKALDDEISALRKAHPEMTADDEREVLQRAATAAWQAQQQGGKTIPKLEDAYAQLAAYKQSVLSAPRPGDSAPRLLPTSGGVPSPDPSGKKSIGQLSSNDTIDLLAGLISGGRPAS